MQTETLIPPKRITLTRVEGPLHLVDRPRVASNWIMADAILYSHSKTAPAGGGYDKVDFEIVFEDGTTYSGRYDLVHHSVQHPRLSNHVKSFLHYLAGEPPAWMRDREDVLRAYRRERESNPEQVAEAKRMLENYWIY